MLKPVSTAPQKIRVLLVDDSVVVRRMLEKLLAREPDVEVIGQAVDGTDGVNKIRSLKPDVVVLDVEMPGMDGIEVVRTIRRENQAVAIIMFSTLTDRGASVALEAMSLGASDYALKPSATAESGDAGEQVRAELVTRIRVHGMLSQHRLQHGPAAIAPTRAAVKATPPPASSAPRAPARVTGQARPTVIAIASSTGGPNALAELFTCLGAPPAVPMLLVQHMPPIFTRILAERLVRASKIPSAEAEDGQTLEAGKAYVAPGGRHMLVTRGPGGMRLRLCDDPPVNFCRPAADLMFRSVAEHYGSGALALVLTGMGEDGLEGARSIRAAGGSVLAQDQASSVVWGMPGAVVKAGVAEGAFSLEHLAREVQRRTAALARRVGA